MVARPVGQRASRHAAKAVYRRFRRPFIMNRKTSGAYEMGYRGPVFDGVRVDANVFYYDYKNLQLSSLLNINGAPTQVTTNAGESSVLGLNSPQTSGPLITIRSILGSTISTPNMIISARAALAQPTRWMLVCPAQSTSRVAHWIVHPNSRRSPIII